MDTNAILSPDRKYRYVLSRTWDYTKPAVMFIGLNPSTADETEDDPTIRRCINFAQSWGFGQLFMLNLFAYRSTDPKQLASLWDPIGPENNFYLQKLTPEVVRIILMWGNLGTLQNRHHSILKLLPLEKCYCFGFTFKHCPKHVLYLSKETKLQRMQP